MGASLAFTPKVSTYSTFSTEAIQYWDRLKDRTARKEWIEPETLLRSSVDVKRNYLGSELTYERYPDRQSGFTRSPYDSHLP